MKKIFILLILALGIFFLVCFYFDIIYPSTLSVGSACKTITEEKLNNAGYYIVGEYDPSNDTITIFYNATDNNKHEIASINKHESCHRLQAYRNILHGCNRKILLFFNEVECYGSEYLPDKIYNKVYLP